MNHCSRFATLLWSQHLVLTLETLKCTYFSVVWKLSTSVPLTIALIANRSFIKKKYCYEMLSLILGKFQNVLIFKSEY